MILEEITPKKKEIEELNKKVRSFLKDFKNNKVYIGGSYAKNTWLAGDADIDIFFTFKNNKDISKKLEKILKKKHKINLIHGSRDYFSVKYQGVLFEIIPVKEIRKASEAENVTDISLLHVSYVRKKLKSKLQNEVRLLKKFCKSNGLYGAESYISGFSGYVLELLIIYYKSFNNLVKKVSKWKDKTVLDIEKYYKNNKDLLDKLNYSKKNCSLIIIDPVQPDRNVAAALSKKNYEKFINLCKNYDGSEKFFLENKVNVKKLKGYLKFKVIPLKGKKDVVGAKLVKTLEKIKDLFINNGFSVLDYGWKWDKDVYFWFKVKSLGKKYKHYGPSKKMIKNLELFKKKHKNVKFENDKAYAILNREFTDSNELAKKIIKDKEIKKRVSKIILEN